MVKEWKKGEKTIHSGNSTPLSNKMKVICAMASQESEDLIFIKELAEGGKTKSDIDRCYPLEHTAEAHR